MSPASHAMSMLRRVYVSILRRMRVLQYCLENGLRPSEGLATVEQLEPKLMLSANLHLLEPQLEVCVTTDSERSFSGIMAIRVADPDYQAEAIDLILDAGNGSLQAVLPGDQTATTSQLPMTITGSLSQVNDALATLNYIPDTSYAGPDALEFTLEDTSIVRDEGSIAITVDSAKDSPVLILPDPPYMVKNSELYFDQIYPRLKISDPESPGSLYQATLVMDHGSLAVSSSGGATITGDPSDYLEITGTLSQVNAALDSAVYSPTTDYVGTGGFWMHVAAWYPGDYNGTAYSSTTIDVTVLDHTVPHSIAVPDSPKVTEDTALYFTPVTGTEIRFSDTQSDGMSYSATFVVPIHGGIYFGPHSGTALIGGDPYEMWIDGTLDEINTAFDAMYFVPEEGYTGTAGISIYSMKYFDGCYDGWQSVNSGFNITIEDGPSDPDAVGSSFWVDQDGVLTEALTGETQDPLDVLTFLLVHDGAHGSVTITDSETGAFTYEPDAGYSGVDSFVFTVMTASGAFDQAVVDVTVVDAAAPASPAGLSATARSDAAVELTWTDQSSDESGFSVEYSADGRDWTAVTVGEDATSAIFETLDAGTTYHFRVFAFNGAGSSAPSNTATATTLPPAPQNLAATVAGRNVTLTWSDGPGEIGYRVEQSNDGGATFSVITTVDLPADTTTYEVTDLPEGASYVFRVAAVNGAGVSPHSATATATVVPAAPTTLAASAVSPSLINLTWADNATGETGYFIEISENGSDWTTLAEIAPHSTSYAATDLSESQTYYFRVTATSPVGPSDSSSPASDTTLSATVRWTGAGDGISWTDPLNWSTGVPGSTDHVVIGDMVGTPVIELSGTISIASLTSAEALKLTSGTSYTAQQNTSAQAGAELDNATITGGIWSGGEVLVTTGATLVGVTLDADMVLADGKTLSVRDGLLLGGQLFVGDGTAPTLIPTLRFSGTQTVSGTGVISLLDANSYLRIGSSTFPQSDLTIAAGIAVEGAGHIVDDNYQGGLINQGAISSTRQGLELAIDLDQFTNTGTVETTVGNLSISVNASSSWSNAGTILVNDGLAYLNDNWTNSSTGQISVDGGLAWFNDAWSNSGTIAVSGGTAYLAGSFNTHSLSGLTNTGGNVYVYGNLDNLGKTLQLSASMGQLLLSNGTIMGGEVRSDDGTQLIVAGTSTLDSVTLVAGTDVLVQDGKYLYINDGLTLNGTVILGDTDPGTSGLSCLRFDDDAGDGAMELSGIGEVRMVGVGRVDTIGTEATLTIGSGITIRGRGTIGYSGNGTIVNQGTIAADVLGEAVTIDLLKFTNEGTLEVSTGKLYVYATNSWTNSSTGQISIDGGLAWLNDAWSNSGTIAAASGAVLYLRGTWSNTGSISSAADCQLDMRGVWSSEGTLESAGSLYGEDATSIAGTVSINGGSVEFIESTFNTSLTVEATTADFTDCLFASALQFNDTSVTLGGAWSALSTVGMQGGALALGGTFSHSSVSDFTRTGGEVRLTGVLDNTGNTLVFNNTIGTWILDGGTIIEGAIDAIGTEALLVSTSGAVGTLSGVDVDMSLIIPDGGKLDIAGGLSLPAGEALIVGDGEVRFRGTQTISGYTTIEILEGAAVRYGETEGATLTLGTDVSIGGRGSLRSVGALDHLVNNGTIIAELGTLDANAAFGLENHGVLHVRQGGKLVLRDSEDPLNGRVITSTPATISGTEIGLFHNELSQQGEASVSYSVSTDGASFDEVQPQDLGEMAVFAELDPGQAYTLRSEVEDSVTEGRIIVDSEPAATLNCGDEGGRYRLLSITHGSSYGLEPIAYAPEHYGLSGNAEFAGSLGGYVVALARQAGLLPDESSWDPRQYMVEDLVPDISSSSTYTLTFREFDWGPGMVWSWGSFGQISGLAGTGYWYRFSFAGPDLAVDAGTSTFSDEAPGLLGSLLGLLGFSDDPVRYYDGTVFYESPDIVSGGLGRPFGQTRSWTNRPQYVTNDSRGRGVTVSDLPGLKIMGGYVGVVGSGTDVRWFQNAAGNCAPQGVIPDRLYHDTGTKEYVFTDTTGNQIRFFDFTEEVEAKRGQFKSRTDSEGLLTYVAAWTGEGEIEEIRRQDESSADVESWTYSYIASGPNAGLLESVEFRRFNGSGWETVRQVEYSYYDGVEAHGSRGDLKTATIKDASDQALETKYYRYYKSGESNGYAHGLKYVFSGESYARLAANVLNCQSADDVTVAPYADQYFEYDDSHRVTRHDVANMGSSADGGMGTFLYEYETSSHAAAVNSWKYKTTETLPDGNTKVVYANHNGQVLLEVIENPGSAEAVWLTHYKYDGDGRLVEKAHPSAVESYNDGGEGEAPASLGVVRHSDTGLIEGTDYYASTSEDIGDEVAGGVSGYVQNMWVSQGEEGDHILVETRDYYKHTNNDVVIYPWASVTVYANEAGTELRTTSYSYTWYPGTSTPEVVTTTHPIVTGGPGGQNGSGQAAVDEVLLDQYGRTLWLKDAEGAVHYTEYDFETGAIVKEIVDVDYASLTTAEQTSFGETGWSTPTGLHLATLREVDALGRPTKITDPNGNDTYHVYNDVDHEIRSYRGWDDVTERPAGPIEVLRSDWARGYTEELTMSTTPSLTAGLPDGSEAIASVESLRRTHRNAGGQIMAVDEYFAFTGLTYTRDTALGIEGTHYYTTSYGYDARSRRNVEINPVGTVTITMYDALGRAVATYKGVETNPNGIWVQDHENETPAAGMVLISEFEYDGGDVGDGNLTRMTRHASGVATEDQVTVSLYDWRNRLITTKAGDEATEASDVNRPVTVRTLNNLGEQTRIRVYDGDMVAMIDADADGLPDTLPAANLRADTTIDFDARGRVYQTTVTLIDQSDGSSAGSDVVTMFWYDGTGRVIKELAANGLVTKNAYDGAGRVITTSLTDGGGDVVYGDADNVVGDIVHREIHRQYDDNGNVILVTVEERWGDSDVTETGELGNATTAPEARITYAASWYDAANRLIREANVGTNGGTAYVWLEEGPTVRTDTTLITDYEYDAAGRLEFITDPRGVQSRYAYDMLGRTRQVIGAYQDGIVSSDNDAIVGYTYDGLGHVVTQTVYQSDGQPDQVTRYVYGVSGAFASNDLLEHTELPNPATGLPDADFGTSYTYDYQGRRVTAVLPSTAVFNNTYDVAGRLRSIVTTTTDGSGNPEVEYTYDSLGKRVSVTDARDNTTQHIHDSLGREIRTVKPDPDGQSGNPIIEYSYDGVGNPLTIEDALGNVATYTCDLLGRVLMEVLADPDGVGGPEVPPVTTYEYNIGGDQDRVIDPHGNMPGATVAHHTTSTVYDQFGRVYQAILPSADGVVDQAVTTYTYDRVGNALTVTDPLGNTTNYTYDDLGRRTSELLSEPELGEGRPETEYAYDIIGNLLTVTDPLNHVTTSTYDALNRQISVTTPDPDGAGPLSAASTTYGYDEMGNITSVIDPLGHETAYGFNDLGRKVSETTEDPDGAGPETAAVTQFHYDLNGNMDMVTDALGNLTTFQYDALNRKTSQILPDPDGAGPLTSGITTYRYDLNGNLRYVVDALGNAPGGTPADYTTEYQYDNLNRQRKEILPSPDGIQANPTTTYAYYVDGTLKSVEDPEGSLTTYTYDNLNRMATETKRLSYSRVFEHDLAGNVRRITDRNSLEREFDYDDLHRLVEERWLDASQAVIHTISYDYDLAGRMELAQDSDSIYTFAYDDADRLTSVSIVLADLAGTAIVQTVAYDDADRRELVYYTINGTDDLYEHYQFDDANRLKMIRQFSQADGVSAGIIAAPAPSRPYTALDPKRADFEFSKVNQITDLDRYADLAGTSEVAQSDWFYDDANRLEMLVHNFSGGIASYSFDYDVADRITTLVTPDGSSTIGYDRNHQLISASLTSEGYGYDLAGNRGSDGSATYTIGDDNQLTDDDTYEYTYDDEGRRETRILRDGLGGIIETTTYTWDHRGRLTEVKVEDGQSVLQSLASYTYDFQDRRIVKQVDSDGDATVDLAEYYVYDGSDLVLVLDASATVTQRYLHGPEAMVIAEETAGDATRWALGNHQDTVRDVISSAGVALDHIVYETFGETVSHTDSSEAIRMGYTGQVVDTETGLLYYSARYYDAAVGRFLSQDPLGFEGGDVNLYRYVGNNPLNNTDPSGLCAESPSWWDELLNALEIADQPTRPNLEELLNYVSARDCFKSTDDMWRTIDDLLAAGMPRDSINTLLKLPIENLRERLKAANQNVHDQNSGIRGMFNTAERFYGGIGDALQDKARTSDNEINVFSLALAGELLKTGGGMLNLAAAWDMRKAEEDTWIRAGLKPWDARKVSWARYLPIQSSIMAGDEMISGHSNSPLTGFKEFTTEDYILGAAHIALDLSVAAIISLRYLKIDVPLTGGKTAAAAAVSTEMASTSTASRAVTRASLNRVKRLVQNLSKPENPGLSQVKLKQLRRIVGKAGGDVQVHLDGVKGTGVRPHAHVENLGSKVRNRHVWLQEGVK